MIDGCRERTSESRDGEGNQGSLFANYCANGGPKPRWKDIGKCKPKGRVNLAKMPGRAKWVATSASGMCIPMAGRMYLIVLENGGCGSPGDPGRADDAGFEHGLVARRWDGFANLLQALVD